MRQFGIRQTDDGPIVLSHDGGEIRMTEAEFHSLKATINLWPERILAQFQETSGEVRPVVSHQIATADVWPDAMQEHVLLILTTLGTQITFSLTNQIASSLSAALPVVLGRMQSGSIT